MDAPGGDAVDGDAVGADDAGKGLGPKMHCAIGWNATVHGQRLVGASEVDDAPEAALAHAVHEGVGQIAPSVKVQVHCVIPLRACTQARERA